jgi:hypothetical protein
MFLGRELRSRLPALAQADETKPRRRSTGLGRTSAWARTCRSGASPSGSWSIARGVIQVPLTSLMILRCRARPCLRCDRRAASTRSRPYIFTAARSSARGSGDRAQRWDVVTTRTWRASRPTSPSCLGWSRHR